MSKVAAYKDMSSCSYAASYTLRASPLASLWLQKPVSFSWKWWVVTKFFSKVKAEGWEERKKEGWQGWGCSGEINSLIQQMGLSDEALVDLLSQLPGPILLVVLNSLLCAHGQLGNEVIKLYIKYLSSSSLLGLESRTLLGSWSEEPDAVDRWWSSLGGSLGSPAGRATCETPPQECIALHFPLIKQQATIICRHRRISNNEHWKQVYSPPFFFLLL